MGVHLVNVNMLYLLWVMPVLVGLYLYAVHRRRRALERFAETDLLKQINVNTSGSRRLWKAGAVMAAGTAAGSPRAACAAGAVHRERPAARAAYTEAVGERGRVWPVAGPAAAVVRQSRRKGPRRGVAAPPVVSLAAA